MNIGSFYLQKLVFSSKCSHSNLAPAMRDQQKKNSTHHLDQLDYHFKEFQNTQMCFPRPKLGCFSGEGATRAVFFLPPRPALAAGAASAALGAGP